MIRWPHHIKSTADWSAIDLLILNRSRRDENLFWSPNTCRIIREGPSVSYRTCEGKRKQLLGFSVNVQKPQRGFVGADKRSGALSSSVLLHYCLPLTHFSCQPTASRYKGDVLLKITVSLWAGVSVLTPKGLRVVWESGIRLSSRLWQEEAAFARCARSASLSLRLFRVHRICAKP